VSLIVRNLCDISSSL